MTKGTYEIAAKMVASMDKAYRALVDRVREGESSEGLTKYRELATKAIGIGLADGANEEYAGRLFQGIFSGLEEVVTQVQAARSLDQEVIDAQVAQAAAKTRAAIIHSYLVDIKAEGEDSRPSDEYRVVKGMERVRAMLHEERAARRAEESVPTLQRAA